MVKSSSYDRWWKLSLLLFVVTLAIFSIRNVLVYPAELGYDASGHLGHLIYLAENGKAPPNTLYSASNPPLYYWIGAGIWKVTQSRKALQVFSLLLYFLGCWLFFDLLRGNQVARLPRLALTAYYAYLPLSLNYPYMIFNYVLLNFLAVAAFHALSRFCKLRTLGYQNALILALLATLAVLTALSGLALWALCFFFLALSSDLKRAARVRLLAVYCSASLVVLTPYLAYRKMSFGCVLCSLHRGEERSGVRAFVPMAPRKYVHFDFRVFDRPVYSPEVGYLDGVSSFLYATWFGDYWGYLSTQGETQVSQWKADQLFGRRLLMWMGIPITFATLYLFYRRRKVASLREALPLVGIALFFAQFFAYIHIYRSEVTWHSGYLWPCVPLVGWIAGDFLTRSSTQARSVVCGYLLVFSAASAVVFWL